MYSNNILNIFANPKNAGRISKPDGVGESYNEDMTAHVEFFIRVENGIITGCNFRAQANPYIVAICSTITTMAVNKMCAMLFVDSTSVLRQLGETDQKTDIQFCIDALKNSVIDYKKKLEKSNK